MWSPARAMFMIAYDVCGLTARDGERTDAALERGDALLETRRSSDS